MPARSATSPFGNRPKRAVVPHKHDALCLETTRTPRQQFCHCLCPKCWDKLAAKCICGSCRCYRFRFVATA